MSFKEYLEKDNLDEATPGQQDFKGMVSVLKKAGFEKVKYVEKDHQDMVMCSYNGADFKLTYGDY